MSTKLYRFGVALLAVLSTRAVAAVTTESCLKGTAPDVANDDRQIRTLRNIVEASCACATFDGSQGKARKDYVKCAATQIRAQVPDNLRLHCVATVRRFYGQATCGRS